MGRRPLILAPKLVSEGSWWSWAAVPLNERSGGEVAVVGRGQRIAGRDVHALHFVGSRDAVALTKVDPIASWRSAPMSRCKSAASAARFGACIKCPISDCGPCVDADPVPAGAVPVEQSR